MKGPTEAPDAKHESITGMNADGVRFPRTANVAKAFVFLLVLAALLLALAPILSTPRLSDDVINYSFRWLAPADFARSTLAEIKFWAFATGRIFVLATIVKNATFVAFETASAYKLYLLMWNLAAAAVFFAYARTVSRSWLVPALAVLLLTVLTQLRDFHDPVSSFNGHFQLSAVLLLVTLIFHLRYLQFSDERWLWACTAVFALNLFLYEIAFMTLPFVLVQHALVPNKVPGRRPAALLLPVFAAYVSLMVIMRLIGKALGWTGPSIYSFGFSPLPVALTFAKQLLATLPFIYFIMKPHDGAWNVYATPDSTPWLGSPYFAFAIPVFFLLCWFAVKAAAALDRRAGALPGQAIWALRTPEAVAILIGIGLLVFPAGMVSIVARYQGQFGLGNGYSLVYFQEIGAALVGAALLGRLLGHGGKSRRIVTPLFCAVIAIAASGNLVDNRAVAAKLASEWDGQYAWNAMFTSPDFGAQCAGLGVMVMNPKPWTETRVVANAGFPLVSSLEDVRKSHSGGEKDEACIARSVRLLGRDAAAYARVPASSGEQGAFRGVAYLVFPLAEGERRSALPIGACGGEPSLHPVEEWSFAGRRFASYVFDPTDLRRSPERGFLLPCEHAQAR